MEADPNVGLVTIYGQVFDENIEPIEGARVELFIDSEGVTQSIGSATTNSDGQYIFTDLETGNYTVTVGMTGYLAVTETLEEITVPGFTNQDITLILDPNFDTNTISGIVMDSETSEPVGNAIVALYSITEEDETLVRTTRTNGEGLYLFGDIDDGDYLVKAFVQENI